MAVSAARVTVTTAAVALNTTSTGGNTLRIKNTDAAAAVDLGASGVTAGAGFPLAFGAEITVDVDPGDVLYAISGGSVVLAVLRT